jgi:GNAT superfamily N-acetyltransferase
MPLPDSPARGWLAGMAEIVELDVTDAAALREFHAVECEVLVADRPHASPRSLATLARLFGNPSSFYRGELLVAREGGRVRGIAELGMFLTENPHLVNLDVAVAPGVRRRGVGRALHDEALRRARAAGRTTCLSAVFQRDAETPGAGTAFALALGYALVEQDDHVVLDLPMPEDLLDSCVAVDDRYHVMGWQGRAPDDLVEAYAALHTEMSQHLLTEGVDREAFVYTVDEIREMEERASAVGTRLAAAARWVDDGALVGYSIADLETGSADVAQLDTMVLPAHRGRGLGLRMKASILRSVLRDHPERRAVHSWNATTNTPIQRLNEALGFRRVEVAWQVQHRVADV